jgi:hypothetical protein
MKFWNWCRLRLGVVMCSCNMHDKKIVANIPMYDGCNWRNQWREETAMCMRKNCDYMNTMKIDA